MYIVASCSMNFSRFSTFVFREIYLKKIDFEVWKLKNSLNECLALCLHCGSCLMYGHGCTTAAYNSYVLFFTTVLALKVYWVPNIITDWNNTVSKTIFSNLFGTVNLFTEIPEYLLNSIRILVFRSFHLCVADCVSTRMDRKKTNVMNRSCPSIPLSFCLLAPNAIWIKFEMMTYVLLFRHVCPCTGSIFTSDFIFFGVQIPLICAKSYFLKTAYFWTHRAY